MHWSRLVTSAMPIALVALLAGACADVPSPSAHLGVRNGHALAFDESGSRLLLFGGADESRVLGDTWSWDGDRRQWRFVTDAGPSGRTFPSMVYDANRGEVVLFGGNRVLFGTDGDVDTFLEDTWTLKGSAWTRRLVSGPTARAEAAIAYDRTRGRLVLFGGYRRTSNGTLRLGDTWEWDGSQWSQMAADGPAPRNGAALAYDERRRTTVLFGGSGASDETWEWDGVVWKRLPTATVPGRFNPAMTYDADRSMIVRFGGWNGKERVADTWVLGAANGWSRLEHAGPMARNHSSMTYDRDRHVVVLFGGHDGDRVFGDTWEWNGKDWTRVSDNPPQTRVDNGH
jgi:hypothetical protein